MCCFSTNTAQGAGLSTRSVKWKVSALLTCSVLRGINFSMKHSRSLTHDERKAAEAAYRGRPFDASWSQAARAVYDGILTARGYAVDAFEEGRTSTGKPPRSLKPPKPCFRRRWDLLSYPGRRVKVSRLRPGTFPSRQEAIEAGLLVDVTKKAKRIGFHVAVGITKSLWDRNITKSLDLDPHEWDLRVRDLLLAVRLKMAGSATSGPWVEVPVVFPVNAR